MENLSNINIFSDDEILINGARRKYYCNLIIIGNVALLNIDGLTLPKVKIGYNYFVKLPNNYKPLSILNTCSVTSDGRTEAYVRLFEDGSTALYSVKQYDSEKQYSLLSMMFLVKKV